MKNRKLVTSFGVFGNIVTTTKSILLNWNMLCILLRLHTFFTGSYVDAHCVGIDTDGHTAVHWIAVKNIGKTAFTNPIDAAKRAEIMSNFYDKHYTFDGKPIRRTQWEHYLKKHDVKEGGTV